MKLSHIQLQFLSSWNITNSDTDVQLLYKDLNIMYSLSAEQTALICC